MSKDIEEFRQYREEMNERLLATDNKAIKRFFNLDTNTYMEGALSVKVKEMLDTLKTQFDYIIIDTAPIGTVADSYTVASISDTIVILVRHNHTARRLLRTTLSDITSSGIKSPNLLLNDVSAKGHSYSYSYNSKYEYKTRKERPKKKSDNGKKSPSTVADK